MGGNPTELDHCSNAVGHKVATTATAEFRGDKIFHCIRIDPWKSVLLQVFPLAVKFSNKMLRGDPSKMLAMAWRAAGGREPACWGGGVGRMLRDG